MLKNEPYCIFRPVVETDLSYIASCIGAAAGLHYARWENILKSLRIQFTDAVDAWRPNAWVMEKEGLPVFLLERVGEEAFLTGPPSWVEDEDQMMLAWQASLVYFFLQLHQDVVCMTVQVHRPGEIKALENLGCRRDNVFSDHSGTHYRYTCQSWMLKPVI